MSDLVKENEINNKTRLPEEELNKRFEEIEKDLVPN